MTFLSRVNKDLRPTSHLWLYIHDAKSFVAFFVAKIGLEQEVSIGIGTQVQSE